MEKEPLSLYELNALVRQVLNESLPDTYWIQAELSDVRSNATGHCYLEFIQKDSRGNNLIAKARGTIWANVYRMLKPYFEESTGQAFVSGIKVMVEVTVEFHELYGFSLTVVDIDPTYTLGDMARKRREILKQLEEEGVLTLNKELEMPMLAQRIAVISSSSAAGYGDFCRQLEENPYGFVFYPRLFPALMQGNQVEESVINALNAVNDHRDEFDVVVIIRGGGATSDLSGFDTYLLAANCAQFPLPIITGIGHERDDTVLDSVAHTRVKTPTAAAQFLITHMHDASESLEELAQTLISSVSVRMDKEHSRLAELTNRLPLVIKNRTIREGYLLEQLIQKINVGIVRSLTSKQHRLMLLEQRVNDASPERLLKRGFSITLKDGKAVTDSTQLKAGDVITTRLAKGEVISEVK
jgi:exodeoxyribonuclease VII large subunit